ncbi:sunset domain-containing protein [Arthrobacter sp. NPDC055138]
MKLASFMRGMAVSAAAASLLFGSVTAAHAAPLPATTPVSETPVDETVPTPAPETSLAIMKIVSPVAPVNGTATVKPAVSTTGWVTVTSKVVTVKQGNKTVVKNKTKAKLNAGTYSVKTTVKYKKYAVEDGTRVYASSKSTTKTQKLVVRNAVALKSIAGKKVPYNGKATIKPNVSAAEGVKVVAKTLTVKLGNKTVAKNKKSASLRAGKYRVTTSVKYRLPSSTSTRTATKTQWLTIKSGKKPSSVSGTGSWNCPAGYPIKGNANSMIYHVPGGGFYNRTKPEECFASQGAAINAGYRPSKR